MYSWWKAWFPVFIGLIVVFGGVISGLMVCCGLDLCVVFVSCVYLGTGQHAVLTQTGSGKDVKHLVVYFSKNSFPEIEKEYGDIIFEEREIRYRPELDNFVTLFFSK